MKKNGESGQALVTGMFFIVFTLLFCGYFLYVSESYFHFFSNEEQASHEVVFKASAIANALNEIAINNQNILASVAAAQDAPLRALERGYQLSYSQPYWETGNPFKSLNIRNVITQIADNYQEGRSLLAGVKFMKLEPSRSNKNLINMLFKVHATTSARGFIVAKALAERNKELVKSLPQPLKKLFVQVSNAQVHCFALQAQNQHYSNPGILNLVNFTIPYVNAHLYAYHMEIGSGCAVYHETTNVMYQHNKISLLNYKDIDTGVEGQAPQYGIYLVPLENKSSFLKELSFSSETRVGKVDEKFVQIRTYLATIPYFKDVNLDSDEDLKRAPLVSQFQMRHPLLECSQEGEKECSPSDNNFLKSFLRPNWAVTGVFASASM
jgi:hypothetical protein